MGVNIREEKCHIECVSLAGNVVASLVAPSDAQVGLIHRMFIELFGVEYWRLQAVLLSGRLLRQCESTDRFVDVALGEHAENTIAPFPETPDSSKRAAGMGSCEDRCSSNQSSSKHVKKKFSNVCLSFLTSNSTVDR